MLKKNIKWMKYICCTFLIVAAGMLYSCNRTSKEDSVFVSALETEITTEETTNETKSAEDTLKEDTTIYVHVCGAVTNPGVYEVSAGKRIFEVIELAGGVTPDGAADALNQAELVVDGQKIMVPTIEEAESMEFTNTVDNNSDGTSNGLVNINSASEEELMTLPGIGTSKAESILSYRKENGKFMVIEDIKNITGIKDGLFNKIKDYISVE